MIEPNVDLLPFPVISKQPGYNKRLQAISSQITRLIRVLTLDNQSVGTPHRGLFPTR